MSIDPILRWKFRVFHIKEAIQKTLEFTQDMTFGEFAEDKKCIDAVLWSCHVISEAAKHIPEDFRMQFPDIPWGDIKSFRNRVIHGYDDLDLVRVWDTVKINFPKLLEELNKIPISEEEFK